MKIRYLSLLFVFVGVVGLLFAFKKLPTTIVPESDIHLLENYRDVLVHYATVGRPDNRSRDIYISSGAAELVANNSTARLPDGTIVVIEPHYSLENRWAGRDGIVGNIHVMQKNSNWEASDYQTVERAGDWNFFSFDMETGLLTDESIFECFDCHGNNSQIDFLFSRDQLIGFGETGEVQTVFCNRPDRLPCITSMIVAN